MLSASTKALYFFVIVMSAAGAFLLAKKNKRFPIAFFTILFFSLAWRRYSIYNSFRYYIIINFYGFFLAGFAISQLIKSNGKKQVKAVALFLILSGLLCCHLIKMFSGYNNVYVLDLQDAANKVTNKSSDDIIYVNAKEYNRLRSALNKQDADQIRVINPNDIGELDDFYLRHSLFTNNLFFFISEDYKDSYTKRKLLPERKSIKTAHFITNSKHNKFVSIYRHSPYTPSPDVDCGDLLVHATLRTYEPLYDAFIYQDNGKIIWLVGADVKEDTSFIFQTHTDEPDLLPEWRIQYGFDNQTFKIGSPFEKEKIGKYRVFEMDIPTSYPVTAIGIAFMTKGEMLWTADFPPL